MKKIVYYISEYGFGHATRSIAIIRKLISMYPNIQIEIVNEYAHQFIKESLPYRNISFYKYSTDIGYSLKEESVQPDLAKQESELRKYLKNIRGMIALEKTRLEHKNIDLIISDISPVAFEVANQLGVISVGITNFTWYTAFQKLVPQELLEQLRSYYEKMDYFFKLAGCNEPEWSRIYSQQFGFYSREINMDEANYIRRSAGLKNQVVFLGLGMKVDLHQLQQYQLWRNPNTHYIVSSNINITLPNVTKIPKDYQETQNYIAACDLVITKAGWGTVGEAVIAGTPLLIIRRDGFTEDENTIHYLVKHNLAQTISWYDFQKLSNLQIPKRNNSFKRCSLSEIVESIIILLK